MLGMKAYTREYVAACRARVDARMAEFEALPSPGAEFTSGFLQDMVLLLDYLFVHRLRAVEGRDGNALNEVRVLANSIVTNGGRLELDRTIRLMPEESILGAKPGETIELDAAGFRRLSTAYFAEIESKFV